jgi:hypothetical protein
MVFDLAWTVGDASSVSCQSLNEVHFFCGMSGGIIALP